MERFELAEAVVRQAGDTLRRSHLTESDVYFKAGHQDLVTYWDKQIERLLRGEILSAFPDDTIVGEEYPPSNGGGTVWYIDPIDGTTNFVNQHRNYAISVGCWDGAEPLFGIVYDVERDMLYWAKRGGGAWRNSEALHVSRRTNLREMLMTTPGVQYSFLAPHAWHDKLVKLAKSVRGVRCLGSVALELCELAAGEADIFATMRSSPWDHNAARIILSEAGGVIYNIEGGPLPLDAKSTVLALCSPDVLPEIQRVFALAVQEGGAAQK